MAAATILAYYLVTVGHPRNLLGSQKKFVFKLNFMPIELVLLEMQQV